MRFKLLDKIAPQNRILYAAEEIAIEVIKREEEFRVKTDQDLRNYTDYFIDYLAQNKSMDDILVEVLCVIREAFYRTHKMLAFRCQLIGAIVVHLGDFAEMMTGEGKTLTLVLAAYINSLYKKGVHIVTVNEYLVERDAEFAEAVLSNLGISCGYIKASMSQYEKKINYAKDITYVSNTELGFDYLRDNLVKSYEDKVQRPLFFAIIDEADSVLIDEARTPLIIAGQPNNDTSDYVRVDRFVKSLDPDDYIIDLEAHAINLSESGAVKAQKYFGADNIYDIQFSDIVHKIINALRANYIFSNGVEYIVRPNRQKNNEPEIVLVDAFTGRIMEGRSYSAGLQQAIQAKEMVEIEPENVTIATITYQSFFRLYKKLAGVSGTAATEAEEILNFYNMVVVQIPTNKPMIRYDYPDYIFDTKKIKWKYVVAEIKKRHKTGQPILVGTSSVEDSEVLHLLLSRLGIRHTVLNAKNHAIEADIIKNAGQKGAITIATNMAGRGTDIKLGEGVRELGGLFVIGTERSESRRVDNQLRGRSGRQGDPGESRFFISLQDSLFKRFAIDFQEKADNKISEDVIDTKFFSKLLNMTQAKIEGLNYDIRKSIIDFDYVLSSQRELFYKQRDIILQSENLLPILSRMGIYVVDQIISNNLDEVNTDIVNLEKVIEEFNREIYYSSYLNINEFANSSVNVVKPLLITKFSEYITNLANEMILPIFNSKVKETILSKMDERWSWFLEKVAKTREGVNLRAYEQKSPLNIFVSDVDMYFKSMISQIAYLTIIDVAKPEIPTNNSLTNEALNEFIIQKVQNSEIQNNIDQNLDKLENNIESNLVEETNIIPEQLLVRNDLTSNEFNAIEAVESTVMNESESLFVNNEQNNSELIDDNNDAWILGNENIWKQYIFDDQSKKFIERLSKADLGKFTSWNDKFIDIKLK